MEKVRLEVYVTPEAKQCLIELLTKSGFPNNSAFVDWMLIDYHKQIYLPAMPPPPLPASVPVQQQSLENKDKSNTGNTDTGKAVTAIDKWMRKGKDGKDLAIGDKPEVPDNECPNCRKELDRVQDDELGDILCCQADGYARGIKKI